MNMGSHPCGWKEWIHRTADYLEHQGMGTLYRAVQMLSEADFWWKPSPASLSVGTILIHLNGNLRQWAYYTLGRKKAYIRDRDQEFLPYRPWKRQEVLQELEQTIQEVVQILRKLTFADLVSRYHVQGFTVQGWDIVFHITEHFATHLGQVLYLVKLRTGREIQMYVLREGFPQPNW